MAPQLDTAQRRAVLAEIAKKLVLQINEIQPFQWDKHDDKDQAIVLAALLATDQQARREALEEAAKAQCMYCNDPGWEPMSNSGYHQCRESGPSLMRCRATAIHELIDRLREGVEG